MVFNGPDPTETNPQDITPPARHELSMNGYIGDDSDEEHEHIGYEPLPQGPELAITERVNIDDQLEDELNCDESAPAVPVIEPMENILTREVWCTPRQEDPIQMDSDKAQQVMSAMANFALPSTSIPEWAQCVPEDQWKHTLHDKINHLKKQS